MYGVRVAPTHRPVGESSRRVGERDTGLPEYRRRSTRTASVPTPVSGGTKREAGERLKRAIHVARAKKGITSDTTLSAESGIAYDTLFNWFSGRTTPRGHELRKMALYLGIPFSELQATYDGVDPEPTPLHESVSDLVEVLRDLVLELRLSRAEQIVLLEQMQEAQQLASGLSRASTGPTRRARPVEER